MLIDPQLNKDMLRFFEDYGVERPQPGVFIAEALNFHLAMENKSDHCSAPYGICDSLDQLRRHFLWGEIEQDPRAMSLILTPIRKSEQPPEGGWRWHKWGTYVGDQEPRSEYIFDEPLIELVYVFETVLLISTKECPWAPSL